MAQKKKKSAELQAKEAEKRVDIFEKHQVVT